MMTENLKELIEAFRKEHPELLDAHAANDQCTKASDEFRKYLGHHSIESRVVEIDPGEFTKIYPAHAAMRSGGKVHEVVQVEGDLIDWTIRQYDPKADCPVIFKDSMGRRSRRLTIKGGCGNLMQHIKAAKSSSAQAGQLIDDPKL
jgi:hypothetical protein